MPCFTWIILLAGAIFLMLTLIRWFEQTTEAVELGWWNKVAVLVVMPFTVWLFPSRISAGRPSPFPLHEPVRGFGTLPRGGLNPPKSSDQPRPGTPAEFLAKPTIPPPKPRTKPAVDPAQIEKLKQKMREQGMLPPE